MRFEDLVREKEKIYQIAAKYHIKKVYVFGSVARGAGDASSDVDLLIELEEGASAFGVGGFQYEVQELLGRRIDVVPSFALSRIDDQEFVTNIRKEAVAV
jgi:predicted nucleotidyltransferase